MKRFAHTYSDLLLALAALVLSVAMGYVVYEGNYEFGRLADFFLWIFVFAFMGLTVRALVLRFAKANERELKNQDFNLR